MTDQARIVATYTAAADHFDTLPFWHEYGRRTVERLRLAPGARVLDLCCGTGASALPAARAVGASGSVLGVDLTPTLVEQARALAAAEGLTQTRFAVSDVEALAFPSASFDAVLSVFGIFFVDDMAGLLRRAWSWLAPGGRLAITVWGEVVLAPGETLFWEAVRREDPSLEHISPSDRLTTPAALRELFAEARLPPPEIATEYWRMPLASPEAFWPVIMGTSNRGVFDALPADAQGRVREFVETELGRQATRGLDMEALVAVAAKGGRTCGGRTRPDEASDAPRRHALARPRVAEDGSASARIATNRWHLQPALASARTRSWLPSRMAVWATSIARAIRAWGASSPSRSPRSGSANASTAKPEPLRN